MKKKGLKGIAALLRAATVLTGSASAATYFGNQSANMWTDVFYSEMTRLYGGNEHSFGYTYTAWP